MNRALVYIIANSINPYVYEVPKILSLPVGSSFQFRFTREWLSPILAETPRNLINKDGSIVMREWENDHLIPIRQCRISGTALIGDILFIKVILGEYYSYATNAAERKIQLAGFNRSFEERNFEVEFQRAPKESMKPLVFSSNFVPDIDTQNIYSQDTREGRWERWANTIRACSETRLLQGVPFVLPTIERNGRTLDAKPGRGLRLKAGARYHMELLGSGLSVCINELLGS